MGILDDLLAGGLRQKEYKDFVDRYEEGDPSQGARRMGKDEHPRSWF
jgi:hypothetical protein